MMCGHAQWSEREHPSTNCAEASLNAAVVLIAGQRRISFANTLHEIASADFVATNFRRRLSLVTTECGCHRRQRTSRCLADPGRRQH